MRRLAVLSAVPFAAAAIWFAVGIEPGDEAHAGVLVSTGLAPVTVAPQPPAPSILPDTRAVPSFHDAGPPARGVEDPPAAPTVASPPATFDAGPPALTAAPPTPAAGVDAGALGITEPPRPPKGPGDPRFTVRWGRPGLCTEELDHQRAALLAGMTAVAAGDAVVYHAGPVDLGLLQEVAASMISARQVAAGLVDWSTAAPHPVIYLYDSVDQLRSVSCVNEQAIAYYDGAIHLAWNDRVDLFEVRATLHHEYIHHVLLKAGVPRPMWLHEGLAMYAASETWWKDPRLGLQAWLQSNHLPFASMTYAFPHTSDRLFALAAYYQSGVMLSLITTDHGVSRVRVLVRALASGQVAPEDAFTWGVGLTAVGTEQRWSRYIAAGGMP